MAKITEDYCSLEVAKLLKKKGFNEKCRGGYHSEFDDNDNPIVMFEEWMAQPYNNDFVDEGFLCSAPTHQMTMAWLREVHNIYLNINIRIILGQWAGYDISVYTTDNDGFLNKNIPIKLKDNISYEQAVEAGIKYALENLIWYGNKY